MIWTVVLWLGMQGQVDNACAQTPPSLCFYKGCEKMAVEIDGGCPVYTVAPVEHVFEIKIKQELTGLTEICSNASFTGNPCSTIPTPMYCPDGNYCKEIIDVTRELWMDGKKLGIIKGDLQ